MAWSAITITRSMFIRQLLNTLVVVLGVLALASNFYIYNYQRIKKSSCSWPHGSDAPIRLMAFGDPQITGSNGKTSLRKRLDIYGNDHFLGHIYESMAGHMNPTQIAVMGDLLSSQWIGDDEFYRRVDRYKQRIFKNPKVDIFNVSGNHDVGYHGEMSPERVERFRNAFGELNFVKYYNNEGVPPLRIVVINSLALDGPGMSDEYSSEVFTFLSTLRDGPSFPGSTILLLHVPLKKASGICTDEEMFAYYEWNTLRSQNHLSAEASEFVLDCVFGRQNRYGGIILTGHDHIGCESEYAFNQTAGLWQNRPYHPEISGDSDYQVEYPPIPEIVVRSMMGEFGGSTGLLSGRITPEGDRYEFLFSLCQFGVQHIWWATKVVSYLFAAALAVNSIFQLLV